MAGETVSWRGSRAPTGDECPLCARPGELRCRSELWPLAGDSGPTGGGARRGRPGRDIVTGRMAGQRTARASGSCEEGRRAGDCAATDPPRAGSAGTRDSSAPFPSQGFVLRALGTLLSQKCRQPFPSAVASRACKADSALCCAQRQLQWDRRSRKPSCPTRTNEPSRRLGSGREVS